MSEQVDYYELLQISPNAEPETIHRIYRLLAQRYHPENRETGDTRKFRQLHPRAAHPAQKSWPLRSRHGTADRPRPRAPRVHVLVFDAERHDRARRAVTASDYRARRGLSRRELLHDDAAAQAAPVERGGLEPTLEPSPTTPPNRYSDSDMDLLLLVLGVLIIVAGIVSLALPLVPGVAIIFFGIVVVAWADHFTRIGPAILGVLL